MAKQHLTQTLLGRRQADEAKVRFGEMSEDALADSPKSPVKREASLKELLLSDEARTDDLVPPRRRFKFRPPVEIE